MDAMEQRDNTCYKCKCISNTALYTFTCNHKMCSECIIRLIFINHMQDFNDLTESKTVLCVCKNKGQLTMELGQLHNLFKDKTLKDTHPIQKDKCKLHDGSVRDYYCKECNVLVCKQCCYLKDNEHFEHKIESNEKLASRMKHYLDTIPLKNKNFAQFNETFVKIGKKFKDVIEGPYNSTLTQIDLLLQILNNFRAEFVTNYKKKLETGIFTLKLLKLFYINYYYDLDKSKNLSDVNLISYLNDVNYELNDMEIEHNNSINQKLTETKEVLENLKKNSEEMLKIKFDFTKVPCNYTISQKIERAHDKLITSLVAINEDKFLSGSKDYTIKYWEEENYQFSNTYTKSEFVGSVLCLLKLFDGRILSSANKDSVIKVWKNEEEQDMKNFICEQTLTGHDSPISAIIQLLDGRVLSGSLDKSIIIWEEVDGVFEMKQRLTKHTECVNAIICLFDSRIVSAGSDNCMIIWSNKSGKYYPEQVEQKHEDRIRTLSQLKDTRIASAGDELVIYIWKEVDGFYQVEQKLKGHTSAITYIIQLKDSRFCSISKDKTIVIWECDGEKIVVSEKLIGHKESVYCIIQLDDGRLISASADNQVIIWKNRNRNM